MSLSKSGLYPETLVKGMFNKAAGKSALAKLCKQTPVKFNGNTIFVFSMDDEVALLAENEAKGKGNVTVAPVKMIPVKIEYGARVSEEFMHASEEEQIDILTDFNDGFARKAARGLDIMAFHGKNPRTGEASPLITQYFDKGDLTVTYHADSPDADIEDAVEKLGDVDVTGLAMAKTFASAMAKLSGPTTGKLYPELAWGGQPESVNGVPTAVNSTVSFGDSDDMAIIGDFENRFKWGYAKDIRMDVIEYGDPDNTGKDLKGHGQVYIRCEAYIGWAILDENAFCRVVAE